MRRKCKESLLRPSLQFSLTLVSHQLLDRLTHREFPAENCQLLSWRSTLTLGIGNYRDPRFWIRNYTSFEDDCYIGQSFLQSYICQELIKLITEVKEPREGIKNVCHTKTHIGNASAASSGTCRFISFEQTQQDGFHSIHPYMRFYIQHPLLCVTSNVNHRMAESFEDMQRYCVSGLQTF